jgi:methionyl-tRNA synthetase
MTSTSTHRPYYVSTAIPYVNSSPHVGFALELIQTDALARYHRLIGRDVHFQTGTDENSLKNARAAAEQGLSTAGLVAENAAAFADLQELLRLSADEFIRTSSDPRHASGVEALWRLCEAAGDIYRGTYSGLYCVGCEHYLRDSDLVDGHCPEHDTAPEIVHENNYYFRLSRYADQILELIESGGLRIVPDKRANEVLALLRSGVEDISISRSRERALGWGIPVPGDEDQVVYVWFDALANYITSLDFAQPSERYQRYWVEGERTHVLGKGITRFHAIYWPAILLSAGLPSPHVINVHGYVTIDSAKISKSLGNSIAPVELVQRHGVDALRYYLLRHIRTTEDGDFSEHLLRRAYESELANGLGNLLSRTLGLVRRHCGDRVPQPGESEAGDETLLATARATPAAVHAAVRGFHLSDALDELWRFVDEANRYVADNQPWRLAKDPSQRQRLDTVLYNQLESLRLIAALLSPFLPTAAQAIATQLGVSGDFDALSLSWGRLVPGAGVPGGPPLFPREP